jgi:hypothetical protein
MHFHKHNAEVIRYAPRSAGYKPYDNHENEALTSHLRLGLALVGRIGIILVEATAYISKSMI